MGDSFQPGVFLSADLRDVDAAEVNFSNFLELSGVRLTRDGKGILLRLRWRCLRRLRRPWRCFVHVLDGDEQVSSLDHEILQGRPPVTEWEPGDEAFECLRLWLTAPTETVRLRLGTYDPAINIRSAVIASNLPVTDESSAVWIETRQCGVDGYAVRFAPTCLSPCSVVFEVPTELAAYSLARCGNLLWLRLKWILRRTAGKRPRGLRFFAHLIPEPDPAVPAVAQFDQDIPMDDRGPATAVEQNVIRASPHLDSAWLRAGLCDPATLNRFGILATKHRFDSEQRCVYLPVPAPLAF